MSGAAILQKRKSSYLSPASAVLCEAVLTQSPVNLDFPADTGVYMHAHTHDMRASVYTHT